MNYIDGNIPFFKFDNTCLNQINTKSNSHTTGFSM